MLNKIETSPKIIWSTIKFLFNKSIQSRARGLCEFDIWSRKSTYLEKAWSVWLVTPKAWWYVDKRKQPNSLNKQTKKTNKQRELHLYHWKL